MQYPTRGAGLPKQPGFLSSHHEMTWAVAQSYNLLLDPSTAKAISKRTPLSLVLLCCEKQLQGRELGHTIKFLELCLGHVCFQIIMCGLEAVCIKACCVAGLDGIWAIPGSTSSPCSNRSSAIKLHNQIQKSKCSPSSTRRLATSISIDG